MVPATKGGSGNEYVPEPLRGIVTSYQTLKGERHVVRITERNYWLRSLHLPD